MLMHEALIFLLFFFLFYCILTITTADVAKSTLLNQRKEEKKTEILTKRSKINFTLFNSHGKKGICYYCGYDMGLANYLKKILKKKKEEINYGSE